VLSTFISNQQKANVNVVNNKNEEYYESEQEDNRDIVACSVSDKGIDPNDMYLMSLPAEVCNPETKEWQTKAVFLDPGANKRFMTWKCAESLGYKFEDGEKMNVYGFNQDIPSSFTSHKVKFLLKLSDGSIKRLCAQTVPKITNPMKILDLDKMNDCPIPEIIGTSHVKPIFF
jgi:hypothetical protein